MSYFWQNPLLQLNAIDVRVVRRGPRWAVLASDNSELFHSRSQTAAWVFVDALREGYTRAEASAMARRSLEREVRAGA